MSQLPRYRFPGLGLAVVKGLAFGPKQNNIPTAGAQGARFQAWFQGGPRVLSVAKGSVVGPKGNKVPTAWMQVFRLGESESVRCLEDSGNCEDDNRRSCMLNPLVVGGSSSHD